MNRGNNFNKNVSFKANDTNQSGGKANCPDKTNADLSKPTNRYNQFEPQQLSLQAKSPFQNWEPSSFRTEIYIIDDGPAEEAAVTSKEKPLPLPQNDHSKQVRVENFPNKIFNEGGRHSVEFASQFIQAMQKMNAFDVPSDASVMEYVFPAESNSDCQYFGKYPAAAAQAQDTVRDNDLKYYEQTPYHLQLENNNPESEYESYPRNINRSHGHPETKWQQNESQMDIPSQNSIYVDNRTGKMKKHAPKSYDIVKGSDERFYHRKVEKSSKRFPQKEIDLVHLRENAYNAEEEKILIEMDEESRGQPPLKVPRLKIDTISLKVPSQMKVNESFIFDEEISNVRTGTSKPIKSKLSILSRFVKMRKTHDTVSEESSTDEDFEDVRQQRIQNIINEGVGKRKDQTEGMSISEIFKNDFPKENSAYFSCFKENQVKWKNAPLEKKPSVLIKLKLLASSSKGKFLKSTKVNPEIPEKCSVKVKIPENADIAFVENGIIPNKVAKNGETAEHKENIVTLFPAAFSLQDQCQRVLSSLFLQVKSKISLSSVKTYTDKAHSLNSNDNINGNGSTKLENDPRETEVIINFGSVDLTSSPSLPNTNSNYSKGNDTSKGLSTIPSVPEENDEEEEPKIIKVISAENSMTVVHQKTIKKLASDDGTKKVVKKVKSKSTPKISSAQSLKTESVYNISEDENEESIYSQSDSESDDMPSSYYKVPRKHYGKKDKVKRDKILMQKLKRHFDIIREEKSKQQLKPSIFQKIVKMFSRKKNSSLDVKRKNKLTFKEKLQKRLGLKKSLTVKHTNSVVIYREKRRKLFHERKEFFEDSVTAYSKLRMPIYHRSDKVLDGDADSQETTTPIKLPFPCTVSDGVFHVRKRKLGQSRIAMKEAKDTEGSVNQ